MGDLDRYYKKRGLKLGVSVYENVPYIGEADDRSHCRRYHRLGL